MNLIFSRKALLLIIFTLSILSACSNNDEKVVEDIQGNTIFVAPNKQEPDEQYALEEVKLSSKTIIFGKKNNMNAVKINDVIHIDYTNDDKTTAKEVEYSK